jgi:hypothetical protein
MALFRATWMRRVQVDGKEIDEAQGYEQVEAASAADAAKATLPNAQRALADSVVVQALTPTPSGPERYAKGEPTVWKLKAGELVPR